MNKTNIAIVGVGKIATDQHLPALSASADFELVATVSRNGRFEGVPAYLTIDELLSVHPNIDAISICVPPVPRFWLAQQAIEAGLHVMLEKPPGAGLAEVHHLRQLAKKHGVSLYATWHSRMGKVVAAAKDALANCKVLRGKITWKEDVRFWHPGQNWVFEAGGMGVFDPGINALSILTHILPEPTHIQSARLEMPSNCQTPIAASLKFANGIDAEFDWRQTGDQIWKIEIETATGDRLLLDDGGNSGSFGDRKLQDAQLDEYPMLYREFFELIKNNNSDVDLAPMIHVSDAMTLGERVQIEPFEF